MPLGNPKKPFLLAVAPMAGVTDRPWRQLCKRLGAGYAVGEMVTSRPDLQDSAKTVRRTCHEGEEGAVVVQIVGTDPQEMADAARCNIDRGAQVIDINMGCPVKKVCNKWAGSALMQNEPLALAIVQAVVAAAQPAGVAVSVKMRTGWSATERNAALLAPRFEDAGVQLLTVHGRTREQRYLGHAEYDTIAAVKASVRIPVLANGDIDSPEKALHVLRYTRADGVMVGRASLGRPWVFRELRHFLDTGKKSVPPTTQEVRGLILQHLRAHHEFHGEFLGVRTARKHVAWYLQGLPGAADFRESVNRVQDCAGQLEAVDSFLSLVQDRNEFWPERAVQCTQGDNDREKAA